MASFFFLDDHPARVEQRKARGMTPDDTRSALVSSLASPGAAWRREVQPPALLTPPVASWRRWAHAAWAWLWDPQEADPPQGVTHGLQQVRNEFMTVVWDLQSYTATRARDQILQARSLRELWHLRADVFRVIAVHRGQAEAHRRLASLNRHFPVKVSQSSEPVGVKASRW